MRTLTRSLPLAVMLVLLLAPTGARALDPPVVAAAAPKPEEAASPPEPVKPPEAAKAVDRTPAAPAASFPADGAKLLIGSLVLVVLLFGAARLVRRLPIGRLLPSAEGTIRVTARTHLGAKERLCLVEVGSTSLLLALTPQGIHTLHVWPQGLPPAAHGVGEAAASDRRSAAGASGIPGQLRSLATRLTATQ